MEAQTLPHTVEFVPSRQRVDVDLARLRDVVAEFLELYAEEPLVDREFAQLLGDGDGEARLDRVLQAAGFAGEPHAFLAEVLGRLEPASSQSPADLEIGALRLPRALALEVLEQVLPGDELFDVKRLARLERLANLTVPASDREELQQVLDTYPVRLSRHVVRQMRLSPEVAYQYLPFREELDPDGLVHTWVGQFHRGVIEQMYRNRVIFVLNMTCPVYCRFCFRKHKECRTQRPPTQRHVSLGIEYIRQSPTVKEIVVTGGDPFMRRPTLTWAVDGLAAIPHVETLRLATRSLAYHPALFTARDGWWLDYLERKQLELAHKGKRLEVATHFIHPDEVSRHSLEVISELTGRGIAVYVQTPFLGGCNDRGPELAELYRLLRGAGAEMHYIFMPCSPLQGNRRYSSSLADGFRALAHLRAHLSDRAVPHMCTATGIGKIDWGGNGWVVEEDVEDPSFLWLRTPYTPGYFEAFAPILDLSQIARQNSEGTLDARFRVEAGDPALVLGTRESLGWSRGAAPRGGFPEDEARAALDRAQRQAEASQGPSRSLVATGSPTRFRVHRTRVELDLEAPPERSRADLDAVVGDDLVTDVVVFADRDALRCLHAVAAVHRRLLEVPQVTALRIRTRHMVSAPGSVAEGVVARIGSLNRLRVTLPLRVEVELVLLHPSEISDGLARVVRGLRRRGVSVYGVIPLLAHLNDDEEALVELTSGCRRLGIEVHHLVLAGHRLQAAWAEEHPIPVGRVIDLATALRRDGSGRELPRLVVETGLGEFDFGVTARPVRSGEGGGISVVLPPETLGQIRELEPGFALPRGAGTDESGCPVVPVTGMVA